MRQLQKYGDIYAKIWSWGVVPPTLPGFKMYIDMQRNGLASKQEEVLRID